MRRIVLLITAATLAGLPVAADPVNRLPREGSGWAGFGRGTWVRTKQTHARAGGVPSVTVTTTTLESVAESTLTLRVVSENALGLSREEEQVVPKSGEAAEGERARSGEPERESVEACGKTFSCLRTKTTITSAAGRREVTVWDDPQQRVRVRRQVVVYDAQGGVVFRQTLALTGVDREVAVGDRTLACLEYEVSAEQGPATQRGKALLSRDIPGGTVSLELDSEQGGQLVMQSVTKALAFEVK